MPSESSNASLPARAQPLRADARHNAGRVLAGARQAIAANGLGVSYHDIARYAGVGVGTVYRRFPDRAELLEAVLLDILGELTGSARSALADPDPWRGFCAFFRTLAARFSENAGLSQTLDDHGGSRVAAARQGLLREIRRLTENAAAAGALRADITWQDVPVLAASVPRPGRCALDLFPTDEQAQRCLAVILDGLAASS
ncbi:MAG: TetR/AcrR family transcriptional regulator [Trebonia sp.]